MKKQLANIISKTLIDIWNETPDENIEELIEKPKSSKHGDLAFPCFILAKNLKVSPVDVCTKIANKINESIETYDILDSVKSIGPFLNFSLSSSHLATDFIPKVISGDYLKRKQSKNEKVMVEYSQPNTHKAFHVGHIRCAALGDSLARVFDWEGFDVVPVNYIGDEGTHIAKCLWYLSEKYQGEIPEKNRGEFLGNLYTKANDLLDLSLLTKAPYPGVIAAEVKELVVHSKKQDWLVLTLATGEEQKTVVTALKDIKVGQLVAYAPPRTRVKGKAVGEVEKEGILSEGMVCSEKEIEVSSDNDKIALLPSNSNLGEEVAEIFKIDKSSESVLKIHEERKAELSKVLQAVENQKGELYDLWQTTKNWSLEEFEKIYKWLDCNFDRIFFESEFGESSKKAVNKFVEKGVFHKSDGAIGVDLSEDGLGFCLLIKSDGTSLYTARDLTLAEKKFEEFGVDRSLYVVDSGQKLHFQQVFKCLELMGFKQADKCKHVDFAQVVRPDGKMSSRKGNVILFSELKERLVSKINEEFLSKYKDDWPTDEIEETAYKISLATMRYGMLNQDNNSKIIFDLDEWTNRSGNTGPYLLYAYARIQSILREAKASDVEPDWSLLKDSHEKQLILHMQEFYDVVEKAANSYSLLPICVFVYELSKKFSKFYSECKVNDPSKVELTNARVGLLNATASVLKKGLELIGISVVDRM